MSGTWRGGSGCGRQDGWKAWPASGSVGTMRFRGALLGSLLAIAVPADAQVVRGRVLDSLTNESVATARVSLETADDDHVVSALTDAGGRFTLGAGEPGPHLLEIERIGYWPRRSEVFEVASEGLTLRNVVLLPEAFEMEGIVARVYPGRLMHEATLSGVYARRARSPAVGSNRVLVRGQDPDYLSGGPPFPVEDCGVINAASFWDFNHMSCGGDGGAGWGSTWLDFVDAHEKKHADQVEPSIAEYPKFDVPKELEGLVAESQSQLEDDALEIVDDSGRCVGWYAATHEDHPKPTFDVWFWQSGPGEWQRWQPSDPVWWPLNAVPQECKP